MEIKIPAIARKINFEALHFNFQPKNKKRETNKLIPIKIPQFLKLKSNIFIIYIF